MRYAFLFPSTLVLIAGLASCQKDTTEVARDLGVLPSTCGQDGARMQATIDGASYCGNAQLIATGDEGTVIITGIDLTGNTLIVQVDSLAVGEQDITEATNGVMYMHNGSPYVVMPGETGTLTITQVDTTAHVLKANFSVTLRNDMNGISHGVVGSLDVVYTVGE